MATPTVREALAAGANGGASATVVTGAGTQVNDLLVVYQGNDFYTAAELTTPTGTAGTWTHRATGDNGSNQAHIKIWTRLVTVGGAQTVTVPPADNEEIIGHCLVIAGVDTSTPIDGTAAGSNGSGASHVAPAVSPTTSDALLLCGTQGDEFSGSGTYTPPSGMTERTDTNAAGVASGSTASLALSASGSTGTKSFTGPNVGYATASVAIRGGGASAASYPPSRRHRLEMGALIQL